ARAQPRPTPARAARIATVAPSIRRRPFRPTGAGARRRVRAATTGSTGRLRTSARNSVHAASAGSSDGGSLSASLRRLAGEWGSCSRASAASSGGETRISSGLSDSAVSLRHRPKGYRRATLRGLVAEQPYFLAPLAREEVDPVRETHPVAARAHHERVRARGVREEAHAAQKVAVRDAGRRDDDLTRCELLRGEDTGWVVDPELARLLDLAARRRPQLRRHLAAEAAERGGGHDRLPRAADPDCEVVVRAADRRRDRGGDSPVLNQLDSRARRTDVLDEVVVAGTVEHDRRDVVGAPAERVGDRLDVVAHRLQQVDRAACA